MTSHSDNVSVNGARDTVDQLDVQSGQLVGWTRQCNEMFSWCKLYWLFHHSTSRLTVVNWCFVDITNSGTFDNVSNSKSFNGLVLGNTSSTVAATNKCDWTSSMLCSSVISSLLCHDVLMEEKGIKFWPWNFQALNFSKAKAPLLQLKSAHVVFLPQLRFLPNTNGAKGYFQNLYSISRLKKANLNYTIPFASCNLVLSFSIRPLWPILCNDGSQDRPHRDQDHLPTGCGWWSWCFICSCSQNWTFGIGEWNIVKRAMRSFY